MIRIGQANIYTARSNKRNSMEAEVTVVIDDIAPIKLAILENEIAQGRYEANIEVPIVMTDSEKTQSSNGWLTCRERNDQLKNHRGQGFSLILGQCT